MKGDCLDISLSLPLSLSLFSLRLYSPLDLGRVFTFLIYTQSVGFFGQGISPSQGRYLHTEQHKHMNYLHCLHPVVCSPYTRIYELC
jgi:hypothetical protein